MKSLLTLAWTVNLHNERCRLMMRECCQAVNDALQPGGGATSDDDSDLDADADGNPHGYGNRGGGDGGGDDHGGLDSGWYNSANSSPENQHGGMFDLRNSGKRRRSGSRKSYGGGGSCGAGADSESSGTHDDPGVRGVAVTKHSAVTILVVLK